MKNNKKILAVLVSGIITSLSAHAQLKPSNDIPTVNVNTPVNVGQGNVYEKEVTPLLRDISKKKSLLELRKLDRELEKLEEETQTAQIERDKALNPPSPMNVTPGSAGFGQMLPSMSPALPAPAPVVSTTTDGPEIRVLMVYGFDNNLYAKVSHGTQGGYIVKKGDILPDGRLVTDVTSNFIEVQKAQKSSKKSKNEKLFVLGPVPVKVGSSPTAPPSASSVIATGSGANALPVGPASGLPPTPTSNGVIMPTTVPFIAPVRK